MRLFPVLAVTAVLLSGCSSDEPKAEPDATLTPSISDVQVYKGLSHDHLKKGQYPQSYEQSPPVGGKHSLAWIKCQVYDVPIPNEAAVHSEEHGAVWLTYAPTLAAAGVAKLGMLAGINREYVLVSPYMDQSSPVVASTWGLQLAVESPDDPRLIEFVRTYAGGDQGNEQGVGCAKNGGTLEQVEKLIAEK